MTSALYEYRNKSARTGAQSVPTGMPTVCWKHKHYYYLYSYCPNCYPQHCKIVHDIQSLLYLEKNKYIRDPLLLSHHIIFIFASQGLRFGSPFSPPLADLEYILRIRALIFHWLRQPVHVSNQKTFYTEHMLSTKCKQRWHRNAVIWQRFATSRFGSNENTFPVCQSFEHFAWLIVSASKLNLSHISFSSLGAAIFNSPTLRSLRFSQFSGCWLILSVYIIMSFDFPFVRLFGVR